MLGRRRRRVPGTCGSAHDQSAAIDGRLAEAGCLSQLARVDNAVTTRHQLIDRLDRRSTTATQVELGAAVQRKCEALALAGQVHEMLTAQDEVLERLEDSSERQLRPAVARRRPHSDLPPPFNRPQRPAEAAIAFAPHMRPVACARSACLPTDGSAVVRAAALAFA
jgi:hypothetical protein